MLALRTLHTHGVVHEDLEEHHIMVDTTSRGQPRATFIDLGRAKLKASKAELQRQSSSLLHLMRHLVFGEELEDGPNHFVQPIMGNIAMFIGIEK